MANLTIPVPDPFVPRIQAAFGKLRSLKEVDGITPRVATQAEVIEEVRQYMKGVVIDQEGAALKTAVVVPDTGIT